MTRRPTLAELQQQMNMYAPKEGLAWKPKFMDQTPRAARTAPNKTPEADSQAEIVAYLRRCCPSVLVAASLNGELRPTGDMGKFYGWVAKLKSRGLLSGDPDLRLTWYPSRCIFIEKKRKKGGTTSKAQESVHATLTAQGFKVYTMPGGIDEMREIIAKEGIPCLESQV